MREETFIAVESLVLENSFGAVRRQKNIELEVTVGIKDPDYGWFEIADTETGGDAWYAEGGLWFDGIDLVDYDGVSGLPKAVADKLIQWGYNVEED